MASPVTTPCAHNFCKSCVEGAFAGRSFLRDRNRGGRSLRSKKNVMKCPACPTDIADFLQNLQVNTELKGVIESLKAKAEENGDMADGDGDEDEEEDGAEEDWDDSDEDEEVDEESDGQETESRELEVTNEEADAGANGNDKRKRDDAEQVSMKRNRKSQKNSQSSPLHLPSDG